jgi:hypothetical protein
MTLDCLSGWGRLRFADTFMPPLQGGSFDLVNQTTDTP